MANNIGTLILATIRPFSDSDIIASAYSDEIKGGHHQKATDSDRNAITPDRQEDGMLVTVLNSASNGGNRTIYQLSRNTWVTLDNIIINGTQNYIPIFGTNGNGLINSNFSITSNSINSNNYIQLSPYLSTNITISDSGASYQNNYYSLNTSNPRWITDKNYVDTAIYNSISGLSYTFNNNILFWDSGSTTYRPYSTKSEVSTNPYLYSEAINPTGTGRTNLNGSLFTNGFVSMSNIGIGISVPEAGIHQDFGNFVATYHKFTNGIGTGQGTNNGVDIGIDTAGNMVLKQWTADTDIIIYNSGSTEVARFTSTGKFTIKDSSLTTGAWAFDTDLSGNLIIQRKESGIWNTKATILV